MKPICLEVMKNHRLILMAAAARSPQWEEVSVAWMKLLHRRAEKEEKYFWKKLKGVVVGKTKFVGGFLWDAHTAAGTYVSFIPEILDDLEKMKS